MKYSPVVTHSAPALFRDHPLQQTTLEPQGFVADFLNHGFRGAQLKRGHARQLTASRFGAAQEVEQHKLGLQVDALKAHHLSVYSEHTAALTKLNLDRHVQRTITATDEMKTNATTVAKSATAYHRNLENAVRDGSILPELAEFLEQLNAEESRNTMIGIVDITKQVISDDAERLKGSFQKRGSSF